MRMPKQWRSRYRPTRDDVMSVMESLELPASPAAIAAAIDTARDLPAEPGFPRTSLYVLGAMLRQLAAENWATCMSAEQWYGRHVYVDSAADRNGLWWPTRKWLHARDSYRDRSSPAVGGAGRTRDRSEVSRAVDRVVEANRAHYEAHKNDFGPGAS